MKTSGLHSLIALIACTSAALVPIAQAAPLAAGKPKFLGGVHSAAQAVNLTAYWNQVTPENAGKWGSVEATRDVMNWSQLDTAYQLAKDNGIPFRFHVLIWGNQQPAWIYNLPPAEQLEEIQEWFAAVAARYPDIDFLEVVNEPRRDAPDGLPGNFDPVGSVDPNDGNYLEALGGKGTTGWDWVVNAFRLARAAFPDTTLVLNEYSMLTGGAARTDYLTMINLLKSEGLVDIISEQGHSFTIGGMSASAVTSGLDALAATGLPIMITEMDMDGADATTVNDVTQLTRYQTVFPALWDHPAVMGITTWGYRTGMWRANAVLVLADGTERSAMTWMRSYVEASNPPLRPTFLHSPKSVTRDPRQAATFAARVTGNPAPALSWQVSTNDGGSWSDITDDGTYSGATTNTLSIASVARTMNGYRFRLQGNNGVGSALSTYSATLTVNDVPEITTAPVAATTTAGGATMLSIVAAGSDLTYQWYLDGVAIAGATGATYTIPSTQHFHAGAYTVRVSNTAGSVTSSPVTVTVNAAAPSSARVMNLSTRAYDLTGDNQLIPGFVISGSGSKRMLVRAVSQGMFDRFGLDGHLTDSALTIVNQDTSQVIASNDDWETNANAAEIVTTSQTVGAFPLNAGSKDAVLLLDLPPGHYTAPAPGVNGATGIAMVEFYDADTGSPTAQLVNISNRGFVDVGARIMIPGFVVSNEGSRTFLVRAVGPGLNSTFGLTGYLADPVLTVFRGSDPLLTSDNWDAGAGATTTSTVATQVGAFPLVAGSKDAAFVITLPPGAYTIQASGVNNTTGVALVELYLVP